MFEPAVQTVISQSLKACLQIFVSRGAARLLISILKSTQLYLEWNTQNKSAKQAAVNKLWCDSLKKQRLASFL